MTITDWIQAISTVVLVIVTGVYAWRTYVISKATKAQADATVKTAKQMVKPTLIPYFRLIGNFSQDRYVQFEAGVNNDGNGPAYDLTFWMEDDSKPPYKYTTGTDVSVLRGHQSVSWSVPDPRIPFPRSDKILRWFFIIKYNDVYGEHEIRQPFVLGIREGAPVAILEHLSRKTLREQNWEVELP